MSMTTLVTDMKNLPMLKRNYRNTILGPLERYMSINSSSRTKAPRGKVIEDDTYHPMMYGVF
jgi:hypothetical protein